MVYIPLGRAGTEAKAKVEAQETAGIEVEAGVPLPLVGAPGASLASSSLPTGGKLQRKLWGVCGPAIADWLIGF